MEGWPSGLRRSPAKREWGQKLHRWVRIPRLPPVKSDPGGSLGPCDLCELVQQPDLKSGVFVGSSPTMGTNGFSLPA